MVELLRNVLRDSWCPETGSDRKHWSLDNRAWGHCAVAAMVDFTKNQFSDHEEYERLCTPECGAICTREYLLFHEDTKRRYKILRLRVAEALSAYHPLFRDDLYKQCLCRALDSPCQKGKYGCLLVGDSGAVIQSTCNIQLEPLKDWCDGKCMRNNIPSRTESMLGACAHAEEYALAGMRERKFQPERYSLYVAGFRSNGLAYIKPEPEFTCIRCAVQIYMHGINGVYVPTQTGWVRMTNEEALMSAKQFARQEKTLKNYDE